MSRTAPVPPGPTTSDPAAPFASAAVVVALDGPSGSGKSSVSRAAARALGVAFLDTGAMYRAVTVSVLRAGVDLADAAAIAAHVRTVALVMGTDPAAPTVGIDRDGDVEDVTQEVRTQAVTSAVSAVAAVAQVRADLILRQRALIDSACVAPQDGRRAGIVAEGRDITTVVAPDADVRILLTAHESVRMARRARQDLGSVAAAAVESVRQAVAGRDAQDARTTSFTTAADGVTTVDSTHLDFEGTVEAVLAVVRAADGRSGAGR